MSRSYWQRGDRQLLHRLQRLSGNNVLVLVLVLPRPASYRSHGWCPRMMSENPWVDRRSKFEAPPDFQLDMGLTPCPLGGKDSSKYVLRREISELFGTGHSLLAYQHFPRERRDSFICGVVASLQVDTGSPSVTCFRTANVAFFLLPQPVHERALAAATDGVADAWSPQIIPIPDCQSVNAQVHVLDQKRR